MVGDGFRFGVAFVVLILLSGGLGSALLTPQVWHVVESMIGAFFLLCLIVGISLVISDISKSSGSLFNFLRRWTDRRGESPGPKPIARSQRELTGIDRSAESDLRLTYVGRADKIRDLKTQGSDRSLPEGPGK